MNRTHSTSHDPELEQLAERFAHWRQSRASPKERIPASLWEQATALCQTRPPSRIAKSLGLCTNDLKKRCQAHEPCTPLPATLETPPNFVEVSPASWLHSGGIQIDIQRPDGARLHLTSQEAGKPVAELIQAFMEVK